MPGKTVLVIDTDIETEQQVMSTLEAAGYLVFAAQTDDVLSENALKVSPSLLFFSPAGSGAQGLETCRLIHQSESFRNIPIIVLSQSPEPMDPKYASLYGIVDIIELPFTTADLLRRTERALSDEGPAAAASAEEAPVIAKAGQARTSRAAAFEPHEPASAESEAADIGAGTTDEDDAAAENFTLTPEPRKGSRLIMPMALVGIIAIAGAAAFFYKDMIFPQAKPAPATAKAPAPAPKPEAAPAAPAPASEQPKQTAEQKPEAAPQPAPSTQAAKPAEAPAPKAASAPPAAAGKAAPVLSVQLGAFREAARAEAMARDFKTKGYDAFVKKTETKDKGVLHRVLVGRYSDRRECQKMADNLRSKEKVTAVTFAE